MSRETAECDNNGIRTSINSSKQLANRESQDEQHGASLVEYVLLVSLIALVCFLAVQSMGGAVNNRISDAASRVNDA